LDFSGQPFVTLSQFGAVVISVRGRAGITFGAIGPSVRRSAAVRSLSAALSDLSRSCSDRRSQPAINSIANAPMYALSRLDIVDLLVGNLAASDGTSGGCPS
jgi:hypothetical protein